MGAPLGLIAGKGDLPSLLVRQLKKEGREVIVITFDKATRDKLSEDASHVHCIGLGQASKVLKILNSADVEEVALVGKVDKRVIFENPRFDLRALSVLKNAGSRTDDSIMLAIVGELEKEGIKVADQVDLFGKFIPSAGVISRRKPGKKELDDIRFGMEMAKGVAGLDIGQTVVVSGGAVVAVEAIEGTDEAIERGGRIAKKGAVVCKVSKPQQDTRFDVPTVGVGTVETMVKSGAVVLAIEAGATLVVDLKATKRMCDENKIAFVAV